MLQNASIDNFLQYFRRNCDCLYYGHANGDDIFQSFHCLGQNSSVLFDRLQHFDIVLINHFYSSNFIHNHHVGLHIRISFQLKALWTSILRTNYLHRMHVRSYLVIFNVPLHVQRFHERLNKCLQPLVSMELQNDEHDRSNRRV